jgi:hypothetical protein
MKRIAKAKERVNKGTKQKNAAKNRFLLAHPKKVAIASSGHENRRVSSPMPHRNEKKLLERTKHAARKETSITTRNKKSKVQRTLRFDCSVRERSAPTANSLGTSERHRQRSHG